MKDYREYNMANFKENPRYNVISLRINDQEKELIKELSRITHKTVSQIMLEAIMDYSRDLRLLSSEERAPA